MATIPWEARARRFLDQESARLKQAQSEQELRLAVMDSHAALEHALRGYLTDVQGIEGLFDKSKSSFPAVVQVLCEETDDSIVPAEWLDYLLAFNSLRNRVVHDAYVPSLKETQSGLSLTTRILSKLLGDAHPYPAWQDPVYSFAKQLGSVNSYRLGAVMIALSVLYIINPIDIPGPLDDFGLTAPCLFSAAMLINAARLMRERSAKKKG